MYFLRNDILKQIYLLFRLRLYDFKWWATKQNYQIIHYTWLYAKSNTSRKERNLNREAGGNVCSRKTAWVKPIIILQHLLCADASLATWCEELTHWKRPWCWERLRAGGEGDNRGWDGWMASPTQRTWVWASSRSWWWTGRPGVLQSMGS